MTQDIDKLHSVLSEYMQSREYNKIALYAPYAKQFEFHRLGLTKTERLLAAGNQLGKTIAGSHEAAFHLTGLYPDWWPGRVWRRGVRMWVGGESSNVVRDTSQKLLMGDLTEGEDRLGTGIIPKDYIIDISLSRGVAQGIDTAVIKNKFGGRSVLKFKTYEQLRSKWQGDTIDILWCDEEPPLDLYSEGLARFTATNGMAFMTFTPLKGMSSTVKRFYQEADETRALVTMTAHDAAHITPEGLKAMLSKYPKHEHDCRINGVPMQGEGRIFTTPEDQITCEPFDLPEYWPRIVGLDIGHGDHPTAGGWLAHDRDADTVYLYHHYRVSGASIPSNAAALRALGRIPVAWPQDANQRDRGIDAIAVKKHYENNSVNMLREHARFPDERGTSLWAGITEMQQRMEQGRFKVFKTQVPFFEEYRNYHMKEGKVVDVDDDLISAVRYGIMMLRHAKLVDKYWYPGQRRPVGAVVDGADFDVLS